MTAPIPAGELLALPPADLAELVAACPGDYVSQRAEWLGLDVDVPEHRAALVAAFPAAFRGLEGSGPLPVDAFGPGPDGVRLCLTPDAAPEPDGHTGEGPAPDDAQSALQPADPDEVDVVELLARYRGSAEPFLCGTFAMYSAPDGSIVIVTECPGRGVEQRAVPGHVVRLALGAAAGKGGVLGRMFGR